MAVLVFSYVEIIDVCTWIVCPPPIRNIIYPNVAQHERRRRRSY